LSARRAVALPAIVVLTVAVILLDVSALSVIAAIRGLLAVDLLLLPSGSSTSFSHSTFAF
jgi:hypothetical protein